MGFPVVPVTGIDEMKNNKNQSALDVILDWSEGRPDWQRDALRRIVQHGSVPEEEMEEIVNLAKRGKRRRKHSDRTDATDIKAFAAFTGNVGHGLIDRYQRRDRCEPTRAGSDFDL